MIVEIIAESLHFLLVASLKIYIRNFVETYEVDTTEQTLCQFYYLAGMSHRVVYTAEHNVLERQATLMCKVVLVHKVYYLGNRHAAFGRHKHGTLLGYGRVHTDSHMTLALVEESLKLVLYTHAAYCYALGAPCIAIIRRKHLCCLKHIIKIVHRLALTHKHNVGELVAFGQRIYLVENVGYSKITLKTLFACLAEQAIHLATHLARHT